MPEILADEMGWHLDPPAGKHLDLNGVKFVKYTETVDHAQFTDGSSTSGTYDLKHTIPEGALYLGTKVTKVTGFAGDTSAALTIGDGSDVDRYNASTINVFATALTGVAAGVPSGALYHTAPKTPKLTITTAADFSSVTAGEVTIEMIYLL